MCCSQTHQYLVIKFHLFVSIILHAILSCKLCLKFTVQFYFPVYSYLIATFIILHVEFSLNLFQFTFTDVPLLSINFLRLTDNPLLIVMKQYFSKFCNNLLFIKYSTPLFRTLWSLNSAKSPEDTYSLGSTREYISKRLWVWLTE